MEWISADEQQPQDYRDVMSDSYQWVYYAVHDGGTNGVKKDKWYTVDSNGYDIEVVVNWWVDIIAPPEA